MSMTWENLKGFKDIENTAEYVGSLEMKYELENSIPVFLKLEVLNSRPMSSWTEREILEYSFMTGQGKGF